MCKTVFISGSSKGIGRACALKFLEMGWNVVASMRSPENEKELRKYAKALIVKLDVTDASSIHSAVEMAIERFGQIDVLINNAGYYSIGVVEAISEEEIVREIDTNLVGLIRVTKAVLPHMREKKEGLMINISSVAGRTVVPLQSIYHATKWGVEGFSRSLRMEVQDFGIDVVLVEPGVIKTDFYGGSMSLSEDRNLKAYDQLSGSVSSYLIESGKKGSMPEQVADKIYRICMAKKRKVQYPVGKSTGILGLYRCLPHTVYEKLIKMTMQR